MVVIVVVVVVVVVVVIIIIISFHCGISTYHIGGSSSAALTLTTSTLIRLTTQRSSQIFAEGGKLQNPENMRENMRENNTRNKLSSHMTRARIEPGPQR